MKNLEEKHKKIFNILQICLLIKRVILVYDITVKSVHGHANDHELKAIIFFDKKRARARCQHRGGQYANQRNSTGSDR